MKIHRVSAATGKHHVMDMPTVTEERLAECWRFNYHGAGKHIQEVFPELSADEREFLLSGITAEEWEEMFTDKEAKA